jgi:hypothetical protein
MNHNFKDHLDVVHGMHGNAHPTAYNGTAWLAWCGAALLGTTPTRKDVDCMTCVVRASRR